MRFLSLRAIFLLGFVIAMPVLALPPVARRIDELLYGAAPADFGRPPSPALLTEEVVLPKAPSAVVNSRYDEPSPAAGPTAPALVATRAEAPVGPSLPPMPQFERPAGPPPTAEGKVDERTIARLNDIRASLEQLGAEYVIVEAQDSGRYRFHCRVLVDANSRFTRPFEATSFDPVAAGQQVLRDVQAWRTAASEPRTAAR